MHHIANHYSFFGKRPDSEKMIGKRNIQRVKEFYQESNRILIEQHGLEDIRKYNYPV